MTVAGLPFPLLVSQAVQLILGSFFRGQACHAEVACLGVVILLCGIGSAYKNLAAENARILKLAAHEENPQAVRSFYLQNNIGISLSCDQLLRLAPLT